MCTRVDAAESQRATVSPGRREARWRGSPWVQQKADVGGRFVRVAYPSPLEVGRAVDPFLVAAIRVTQI